MVVVGHEKLFVEGGALVIATALAGRQLDRLRGHVHIGDLAEQMADAVQARTALVVGLYGESRRFRDVGMGEHLILRAGEVDPAIAGFKIHGAELPAPGRILEA